MTCGVGRDTVCRVWSVEAWDRRGGEMCDALLLRQWVLSSQRLGFAQRSVNCPLADCHQPRLLRT